MVSHPFHQATQQVGATASICCNESDSYTICCSPSERVTIFRQRAGHNRLNHYLFTQFRIGQYQNSAPVTPAHMTTAGMPTTRQPQGSVLAGEDSGGEQAFWQTGRPAVHSSLRAENQRWFFFFFLQLVSWCFKPSQPQRIILGLRETFTKTYIVERTNKAKNKTRKIE